MTEDEREFLERVEKRTSEERERKKGGGRQRNTKTGRKTGIDRESSKVRDSRKKKETA